MPPPARRQVATLETRKAKDRDLTDREPARALAGEGRGDRPRPRGDPRDPRPRAARPPEARRVAAGRGAVTAHASHFDRRDAIQAVADSLPAGRRAPRSSELADAFLARPVVIRIAETAKGERFTTRAIWELERRRARRRRGDGGARPTAPSSTRSSSPASSPAARSMKPDQEAMVAAPARAAARAWSSSSARPAPARPTPPSPPPTAGSATGIELRVAAPTWRAANVLRSEGLDATSVARLLAELDRGTAAGEQALARGSVLLVDEAGMVDSRGAGPADRPRPARPRPSWS